MSVQIGPRHSGIGYKDHIAYEVWSSAQTSQKSDIWALGMTLYRLSKEDAPRIRRVGRQDWFFVPDPATAEGAAMAGRLF